MLRSLHNLSYENGKYKYKVFIVVCITPALQASSVSRQCLCWGLKICPTVSETSNPANDIGTAEIWSFIVSQLLGCKFRLQLLLNLEWSNVTVTEYGDLEEA